LETAQALNNSPVKSLIQANDTRWNSEYDCMERFLEQYQNVSRAFSLISADKEIKTTVINLSIDEAAELAHMVQFLGKFKIATKYFEGSNCTQFSIGGIVPVIWKLISHCDEFMHHNKLSANMTEMVENVKADLASRFVQIDHVFLATCYFDPVLKEMLFLHPNDRVGIREYVKKQLEILSPESTNSLQRQPSLSFENFFAGIAHLPSSQNDQTCYENEKHLSYGSDPFNYWRTCKYDKLKLLARKFLAIRASQADVERDFSWMGGMVTNKRNRLDPAKVAKMTFIHHNIQFSQYYKFF